MIKQKFLTALLALLTISATGAWAAQPEETLLTTINSDENTDFKSGSKTFDNVATLTISGDPVTYYDGGWMPTMLNGSSKFTITAAEGYIITKCKIFDSSDASAEDTTAPFEAVVNDVWGSTSVNVNGNALTERKVLKKIEVYGYENVPEPGEVTINETKTEASFDMPQNDVTVTYTLKRDMAVDMAVSVQDDQQNTRFRVEKKQGGGYQPYNMTQEQVMRLITVRDTIEDAYKDVLTASEDYTVQIYPADAQGNITGEPVAFTGFPYVPGHYVVKAIGQGNYVGQTEKSNVFTLYQGYPVEIAAHGFATYYSEDEALTLEETFAETAGLYTVAEVTPAEAVLSEKIDVMPKATPMLIYNESETEQTVLLIPTTTDDDVFYYAGFKGTAVEKEVTAAEVAATNFYVLTDQNQFVWVKDAGTIAAHRCWLEIAPSEAAGARRIVFSGSGTTGIDAATLRDITTGDWYDLNGRKFIKKPTKKGIYIQNGKKVVVK